MRAKKTLLSVMAVALVLLSMGCGKKGDLVLPDRSTAPAPTQEVQPKK